MTQSNLKSVLTVAAALLLIWLSARYLMPILLPFLLAALTALAAEPLVAALQKRTHLPRNAATGIGVGVTLLLLGALVLMLGALLFRQLQRLMEYLPDLEGTAMEGITALQNWLLEMAQKAPQSLQPALKRSVEELFSGGAMFFDRISAWLLALASGVVSHLPGSALGIGTWLLASFMVSAKLPKIRRYLKEKPGAAWKSKALPTIRRLRSSVTGWLTAQLKLMSITFGVLTTGFLLLRVEHAPWMALLVSFVDALPILGTGMVLIPWSIVCFLQGEAVRGVGLLATYAAAMLLRTMLEPKLVGKQLGLDSLVTLAAMYAGYRLWGVLGLLFAPLLTVAAAQLFMTPKEA